MDARIAADPARRQVVERRGAAAAAATQAHGRPFDRSMSRCARSASCRALDCQQVALGSRRAAPEPAARRGPRAAGGRPAGRGRAQGGLHAPVAERLEQVVQRVGLERAARAGRTPSRTVSGMRAAPSVSRTSQPVNPDLDPRNSRSGGSARSPAGPSGHRWPRRCVPSDCGAAARPGQPGRRLVVGDQHIQTFRRRWRHARVSSGAAAA